MLQREPSRRLRQISHLLSRQAGEEGEEDAPFTCSSCPLLLLLLLPLLSSISLIILGLVTVYLCPSFWLPRWLLLLGLLLPSTAALLSCSPDPLQPLLSCLHRLLLGLVLFSVLWCFAGIFWASKDDACLPHLGVSARLCLFLLVLVCGLLHWLVQTMGDTDHKHRVVHTLL